MKMMFILSTLLMMILLLLMIMLNFISMKLLFNKEKNSPYECGFDPNNNSRLPFSIQFFLIAMIFLIFDVEIVLILPIISIMKFSSMNSLITTMSLIFLILILGIYHEWNQGALSWLN